MCSSETKPQPARPILILAMAKALVRPRHVELLVRGDLEIVAAPAGPRDRMSQRGLIDTVFYKRLVEMDGDDLAEGDPGLQLPTFLGLELDDLDQLAFHHSRAFADTR